MIRVPFVGSSPSLKVATSMGHSPRGDCPMSNLFSPPSRVKAVRISPPGVWGSGIWREIKVVGVIKRMMAAPLMNVRCGRDLCFPSQIQPPTGGFGETQGRTTGEMPGNRTILQEREAIPEGRLDCVQVDFALTGRPLKKDSEHGVSDSRGTPPMESRSNGSGRQGKTRTR